MTPEERDRWAEQWMDAALEQRRNVEPRPGLEARVLANLTAAGTQAIPRPWLHLWSGRNRLVAVAVAAILIFAVAYALRPTHRESKQVAQGKPTPSVSSPSAANGSGASALPGAASQMANAQSERRRTSPGRESAPTTVAHVSRRDGTQAPRLAQFPAPAPLSSQEQLLLRYVQETPREELIAVMRENQILQERSRQLEAETDAQRGPTN
jgi:hypothetical protein